MISIIHISDLHFSELVNHQEFVTQGAIRAFQNQLSGSAFAAADSLLFGQHCSKIAKISADFIARNMADHDAIIISGDLATRGRIEDLLKARSFVFDRSTPGYGASVNGSRPTLAINDRPIHILPGNHDRFQGYSGLPNCRNFDSVFSSWWDPQLQVDVREITAATGEKIFFVFVDFCLHATMYASSEHPFNIWGQGTCLTQTLEELVRVTGELQQISQQHGIIWVSHFVPPTTVYAPDMSVQLNNGSELLAAAEYCNIRYILCGHVHEPMIVDTLKCKLLISGSATLNGAKYGNWIHSLNFSLSGTEVELVDKIDYCFDFDLKDFQRAPVSQITVETH